MVGLAYWYTALVGWFFLVQGIITFLFNVIPSLDQAFPILLKVDPIAAPHSLLHILLGVVAITALFKGGVQGPYLASLGIGAFYVILAVAGFTDGRGLGLGLQSFDHPFHLGVGLAGLLAGAVCHLGHQKKI